MTPKEFFDTVVKMRNAQREYFKSNKHNRTALSDSKHYERIIDAEIKRVELLTHEQRNPRLIL